MDTARRKFQAIYTLLILFLLPLIAWSQTTQGPVESFTESLFIRSLDSSNLGLRFEFTSRKLVSSEGDSAKLTQYRVFPSAIGQILRRNVSEIQLVMTR